MRLDFRGASKGAFCAIAAAVLSAISVPSYGSFTPVNSPAPGEKSHAQIFDSLYGGTFVTDPTSPFSFTNGTVRVLRIEDEPANTVNAVANPTNPLLNTDQVWDGKILAANAVSKYALFSQNFGLYDNAAGTTYTKLFDVSGYGATVGGSQANPRTTEFFRLVRGGENGLFSSLRTDNRDQYDHMVTYKVVPVVPSIVAGNTDETFLAFFEDKLADHPSDFDYNDLVVKLLVQGVVVPEPTSLGLLAVAGTLLTRRRR